MPAHAATDGGWIAYFILMALVTGGMLLWWLLSGERHRTGFILPAMMLGGSASSLLEPALDNIVLFWYPQEVGTEAFAVLGRNIPWAIPIGYAWFVGGLPFFAARYFARRSLTPAGFWTACGVVVVLDFLAIGSCTWLNVAGFYGSDVLRFAGYPLWWAPFDVVIAVGGGAVLYLIKPFVRGWRRVYLVSIPPVMTGFVAGTYGLPIMTALRGQWSTAGMIGMSALVIALGVATLSSLLRILQDSSEDDPRVQLLGHTDGDAPDAPGSVALTPALPNRFRPWTNQCL